MYIIMDFYAHLYNFVQKWGFDMKRVFTMLLVVAMLAGVLSAGTMSYAHAAMQMVGDVNGDGKVNNRDLGNLQQIINGWEDTADGDADVNGDTKVNNKDLGSLQQIINGIPTIIIEDKQPKAATASKYTVLGTPAAEYYPNNYLARCAWDMAILDGRLYVGCGDYSKNPGDAPILSAPLSAPDNWTVETTIPDEQVGRFININGVLTIPGFDPVASPKYGSYYERLNGEWVKQEILPFGLHNFDIAWFQGRMYAGIGANRGEYPVAYTEDGKTYQTLPLYKNGQPVDTSNSVVIRCSNLYVLGDNLYADFWYEDETLSRAVFEMYHYNIAEDRFEYVADLKEATHGGKYSPAYLPLWSKAALGDKMFLSTGYLFYTSDFETYTQVTLPNDATVYDMATLKGRLYLLSAYEKDGQYQVTVYSTTADNPSTLRAEASFSYALAPTSFAVDADNLFIGMGNWYGSGSAGNGTILHIDR